MFFIKDGKTEYKLIVKAPASERVEFAVKEWTDFILEATSCQMQRAEEGYTGKAVVLTYTDKGNEGYRIYTENGNYCVEGYCEKGLIYGVYGLLRRIAGLIFYTSDVYDIKKGDIAFSELDEERIPDFGMRAIHSKPLTNGTVDFPLTKEAFRMGVSGMGENWGICNHSYFRILPPDVYKEAHPDWYSQGDGGKHLCLSNLEMRKEFVERLKKLVLEHPKSKYFMLGHADDRWYNCKCEKCQEAYRRHNKHTTLLELEFINDVTKNMNAWMKKEGMKRDVVFVMFAYLYTLLPPVEKVGDKYVPLFDFELEKNIGVLIAPINARGDKSYFDEENYVGSICYYNRHRRKMKDVWYGWRSITDEIMVWAYCNDFADTIMPFNCWDALEGNYRGYKEVGMKYVFEEGNYSRIVPNFHYLRAYVVAKLMWDSSYSLERAIDEFMVGFYGKDSAPYMRKYFDFLRDCCRKIASEKGRPMFYHCYTDFSSMSLPEYWELSTLEEALRFLDEAVAHADEAHKERVQEEGFPVWYLITNLYNTRLSEEQLVEYSEKALAVIEKYGLMGGCEGVSVPHLRNIERWVKEPIYRDY